MRFQSENVIFKSVSGELWMGVLSLIARCLFYSLNIETRPNLRKRRDLREVQFEVTMDISADDEGDFQEFQMLHHHSRIRRSARQCGSQICNGESYGFT